MNKIMIISPHHDDEVIGCGGAVCLHKQRGNKVTVVFMAAGWSGVYWEPDRLAAAALVQQEAKEAAAILGVDRIEELNLEDRNLSFSATSLHPLIRVLRAEAPETVYLPHILDGDREHRLTHEIAKEAIWLAASEYLPELGVKMDPVKTILAYEVWKPMGGYQLALDITSAAPTKLAALACYKSQLKLRRWDQGSLGLSRYRGVASGVGDYAEVFQVIKISDTERG